jgi:hypothetical protein
MSSLAPRTGAKAGAGLMRLVGRVLFSRVVKRYINPVVWMEMNSSAGVHGFIFSSILLDFEMMS